MLGLNGRGGVGVWRVLAVRWEGKETVRGNSRTRSESIFVQEYVWGDFFVC